MQVNGVIIFSKEMLLMLILLFAISNWYLVNLLGADWKLHLYGRVFYEGNCHEGKRFLLIAKHILITTCKYIIYNTVSLLSTICYVIQIATFRTIPMYLLYVWTWWPYGLVCLFQNWASQVWTLDRRFALCSWAKHFTSTVPLPTQVYRRVPANLNLGVTLW